MIKIIDLKEVLRNKRFIMFTIIIPAFWYILLINMTSSQTSNSGLQGVTILGIASMIGIIGNSLTTFSKRISNNKNFFKNLSLTSEYGHYRYLIDQIIVQTILNLLIFILIALIGIIMGKVKVTNDVVTLGLLSILMGWYFSAIGFIFSTKLNTQTMDAISFPLIILGALTIVPFNSMGDSYFINIISKIQEIFPGYYFNLITSEFSQHNNIWGNMFKMIVSGTLTVLPLLYLLHTPKKIIKENRYDTI